MLDDAPAAIARLRAAFEGMARSIDETDGLGLNMGDWRFNLHGSNTEPIVRLNVEARSNRGLIEDGVTRVKVVRFE